jgi:hypothetical protein
MGAVSGARAGALVGAGSGVFSHAQSAESAASAITMRVGQTIG